MMHAQGSSFSFYSPTTGLYSCSPAYTLTWPPPRVQAVPGREHDNIKRDET